MPARAFASSLNEGKMTGSDFNCSLGFISFLRRPRLRRSDSFVKTKCSPSPQCYIVRGLASSREELNEREKIPLFPSESCLR